MSLTETQTSLWLPMITFLFWLFSEQWQTSFHPVLVINCYIFADIISLAAGFACEEEHRRLNLEEHGEGASKTILCRLLFSLFFLWLLETIIELRDEIGKLKRSKSRECSHLFSTSPLTHLIHFKANLFFKIGLRFSRFLLPPFLSSSYI